MPNWKLDTTQDHRPQIRKILTMYRFNPMARRYLRALGEIARPLTGRQIAALERVVNRANIGKAILTLIALYLTGCGSEIALKPGSHSYVEGVQKCTAACQSLGERYSGHSNWTEPGRYLCVCTTDPAPDLDD